MPREYSSEEIRRFVSSPLFDKNLKKNISLPKISIITPSYNQGVFIEKTILSVLNQNYPNLEYIIIDGGSSDNTLEIIKKYKDYISYWVSEPDDSQVDAINKGFKRATGEIIAWQNSDDIYLPDVFFKVADSFRKNPKVDVIYGFVYIIDMHENIINDYRFTKFNLKSFLHLAELFYYNQSCFFKKDLLNKVGLLNKDYQICFDFEFFIRVAKITNSSLLLRDYLGAYRIHNLQRKTEIKGESIGRREQRILQIKEGINQDSLKFKIKRYYYLLRKFVLLIIQGDIEYIYKKSKKYAQRLSKKISSS
jgi:glycosyltransferase involved in cell wall biosynthesis